MHVRVQNKNYKQGIKYSATSNHTQYIYATHADRVRSRRAACSNAVQVSAHALQTQTIPGTIKNEHHTKTNQQSPSPCQHIKKWKMVRTCSLYECTTDQASTQKKWKVVLTCSLYE